MTQHYSVEKFGDAGATSDLTETGTAFAASSSSVFLKSPASTSCLTKFSIAPKLRKKPSGDITTRCRSSNKASPDSFFSVCERLTKSILTIPPNKCNFADTVCKNLCCSRHNHLLGQTERPNKHPCIGLSFGTDQWISGAASGIHINSSTPNLSTINPSVSLILNGSIPVMEASGQHSLALTSRTGLPQQLPGFIGRLLPTVAIKVQLVEVNV